MPTPCTVTGTLNQLTSGLIGQGRVLFQLTNIGTGNPIGVTGTAIIPQLTYTLVTAQNGTFTVSLWGNDNINPSNTLYSVTFFDTFGNSMGPVLYSITGSSVNLNTAIAANTTSPPILVGGPAIVGVPLAPQSITGQSLTLTSSAPLNVQGTATFTGSIFAKNIEGVAYVDGANTQGWAGADPCAWIISAQATLSSIGGTVDARGVTGVVACAGTFNVGSTTQGVTVLLGAVNIAVQNTIIVGQGSRLQGLNGGSGNLGTTPTTILAGSSFPTSGVYLVQMGALSGTSDGVSLRDVQLNCNNIALSKGVNVSNVQDIGDLTNVFILHNVGNGVDITGSAQNVTFTNVLSIASSSATADNCFTIPATADHITFINSGCTSNAVTASTGAAFQCNGCNMTIVNSHVEDHADGVLLSGSGANQGAVVIDELDGLSNITNTVHIASNWNGSLAAFGIRKFLGANSIKNDVAAFVHTCTDEVVGHYILGANVGQTGPIQLNTDCSVAGSGTMFSIRKGPFAFSSGTAGNFAPDVAALLDLRYPSASVNGMRMDDTTNSTSYYLGPGVGGNFFGLRDRINAKQGLNWAGNTNPVVLPQGLSIVSLLASPTAPTIAGAGCGGSAASIPNNNGTAAFTINVGTAPTAGGCTVTMPAAATGWNCSVTDITTNSTSVFLQKQLSSTTTSVVLVNYSDVAVATAPTANDIWRVSCHAY